MQAVTVCVLAHFHTSGLASMLSSLILPRRQLIAQAMCVPCMQSGAPVDAATIGRPDCVGDQAAASGLPHPASPFRQDTAQVNLEGCSAGQIMLTHCF